MQNMRLVKDAAKKAYKLELATPQLSGVFYRGGYEILTRLKASQLYAETLSCKNNNGRLSIELRGF